MKKIAYLLCSLCLVTFASKSAHADSLASYVGQTINMTVRALRIPVRTTAHSTSGLTQVNLATTTGKAIGSIEAFCDDFTHEISTPDHLQGRRHRRRRQHDHGAGSLLRHAARL